MRNKQLIRDSCILLISLFLTACAARGSASSPASSEASSVSSSAPLVAKDQKAVYDAFVSASKNALSAPNVTINAVADAVKISDYLAEDGNGHHVKGAWSVPGMTLKGSVANKTNPTYVGKEAAFDIQGDSVLHRELWGSRAVAVCDSAGSCHTEPGYASWDTDYDGSAKAYFKNGSMYLDLSDQNLSTPINFFERILVPGYNSDWFYFEPGKYCYADQMAEVNENWDEGLSDKLGATNYKDAYAAWFSGAENGASAYKARIAMTGSQIRNSIKTDDAGNAPSLPWIANLLGKTLSEKLAISDDSSLTLDIDYDSTAIGKIAWDANIVGKFTSNINDEKGDYTIVTSGSAALDFASVPAIAFPEDMTSWTNSLTHQGNL